MVCRSFVSSRSPDISIYSILAQREETKISTAGAGVRSFAVNPSGEYIGVLDEGRGLSIVAVPSDTGALGKKYLASNQEHRCSNLVPADIARKYDKFGFAMSWNPTELCLAVPADKQSISIFRQQGKRWEEEPLVCASEGSDLHHLDVINIVRFSPNGRYLASADIVGNILVWDMNEKSPISKISVSSHGGPTPLFDLQWGTQSDDNYIIVVTATSSGKFENIINLSRGLVSPAAPVPITSFRAVAPASGPAANMSPKPILSPPPANDFSAEEKHKRIKKIGAKKENDANKSDDEDLFAGDAADDSIEAIKQQSMKNDRSEEDDVAGLDDRYGNADAFIDNQQYPYAMQGGALIDADTVPSYLHNPIEPASTPFDEKGRRYMFWNLVGNIVCREEDSGNRIEIKFADISGKNKNFNFVDSEDFKLAALSYEGALFANQPEDPEMDDITGLPIRDNANTSDKKGSDIRYHAFAGQTQLQGANETFSMTLPVGEIVDCLAVGMGWAAVATSKNFLRIFSSTALQLSLNWLRGPVVCTIGYGSQLAVFYNDGSSFPDGSPNLAVELLHISPAGIRQEAILKVPITPGGSLLQWTGFSEDGLVYILDTAGMLSGLMRMPGGWQWVPLLDTAKASKKVDHKFWPICVKSANLCYVLLNGESKPLVYPQPVVSIKPLNPPIVEVYDSRDNKEKAVAENVRNRSLLLEYCAMHHLEERLNTAKDLEELDNLEDELTQKKADADKVLLLMFKQACAVQRNAVSTDIALRLHSTKSLEIAITIAQHFQRPGLTRLLENIMSQKHDDAVADTQLAAKEVKRAPVAAAPLARPPQPSHSSAPIVQHTPPREYLFHNDRKEDSSAEDMDVVDHYDNHDPAVVTPGEKKESSFTKKKNILNSANVPKPLGPPANRFAQGSSITSPTKKRSLSTHDDLKSLRSSPSPVKKKPALSVSAYLLYNESFPALTFLFVQRDNSFAREARTKQANDRNVLR